MNEFLRVLSSSYVKEMRIWRRNPRMLMLVVLLPLLYWIAFTLLMGGVYSVGINAALVVEETNPGKYTNGLIEILNEPDSIPPSINLIEMDAETADILFLHGDVILIITIPEEFEQALSSNESTSIQIRVYNAHEDMTKNLRMPVMRKLDLFYQTYLHDAALVDFEYEPLRESTPPRLGYMAWTIAIYAIMFGGLFIAASTVTREFEQDTLNEILLCNQSPIAIYTGKILCGLTLSFIPVPILFVSGWVLFGSWPQGDIFIFLSLAILLSLFSASIGTVIGALFRNSVYIVPITAIVSVFYWLTGGGIAPLDVTGLQFSIANEYLPISNVYRSLIAMFVEGNSATLFIDLNVIALFAASAMIAAPFVVNRIIRIDFSRKFQVILQKRREQTIGKAYPLAGD
jgi:ABC-2 type transport system permease protein